MNSNFGLLFLLIVPFSSAETTKQLEANFTCKQFGRNNQTNITSTYTLKPGTEVLAVRCRNYRHKPWILGSVSNGLVTDTRWKCTSLQEHLKKNNLFWRNPYFDDSQWAQAIAKFSNQEVNPWGKVLGIRDEALWISTADKNHTRLFCRRRLSDLSLKRAKDSLMGMFQATIDDVDHALLHRPRSQHEVGDVVQCFKKCQGDSQCHSFNFEHDSVLPTRKCELNDATKGQDPVNYVRRPGYTYYENVE